MSLQGKLASEQQIRELCGSMIDGENSQLAFVHNSFLHRIKAGNSSPGVFFFYHTDQIAQLAANLRRPLAPGMVGRPGPAGPSGTPGVSGSTGHPGTRGPPGYRGLPGELGDPGTRGRKNKSIMSL